MASAIAEDVDVTAAPSALEPPAPPRLLATDCTRVLRGNVAHKAPEPAGKGSASRSSHSSLKTTASPDLAVAGDPEDLVAPPHADKVFLAVCVYATLVTLALFPPPNVLKATAQTECKEQVERIRVETVHSLARHLDEIANKASQDDWCRAESGAQTGLLLELLWPNQSQTTGACLPWVFSHNGTSADTCAELNTTPEAPPGEPRVRDHIETRPFSSAAWFVANRPHYTRTTLQVTPSDLLHALAMEPCVQLVTSEYHAVHHHRKDIVHVMRTVMVTRVPPSGSGSAKLAALAGVASSGALPRPGRVREGCKALQSIFVPSATRATDHHCVMIFDDDSTGKTDTQIVFSVSVRTLLTASANSNATHASTLDE